MTITLTSKEFDEAVLLWLKEQGFSTDRYSISTRTIVGRGDSGSGTRVEATLEPMLSDKLPLTVALSSMDTPPFIGTNQAESGVSRRFGVPQGHSDE